MRAVRRSLRHVLLAALLALAIMLPSGAAPAEGLMVISDTALTERLHEIVVYSPAMARETTLRVLLPTGYDVGDDDEDYPVLYLLHGCCDTYRSWSDKTDLEEFTAGMDVLVVMPDAGQAGFYSDWYNHGLDSDVNWESYHIGELIPWVEETYDVKAERNGRILAGLSMGGFGAFTYAARHPDLFVSSAAFSPAIDTNIGHPVGHADLSVLDGGIPQAVWGNRQAQEVRWRGHNPWDLAGNLSTLDVWIITGNGLNDQGMVTDPVEFYVNQQSHSTHDRLTELGVEHYFEDYGVGGHTWDKWQADLHVTLPEQLAHANSDPATPRAFTYTAIEPAFDIFGYEVVILRDALEFATIDVQGPGGFSVSGSGTAHVTTADVYKEGEEYLVTVGGGAPSVVTADDDGRLFITVPLGAAHPFQQFTAPAIATGQAPTTSAVTIAEA